MSDLMNRYTVIIPGANNHGYPFHVVDTKIDKDVARFKNEDEANRLCDKYNREAYNPYKANGFIGRSHYLQFLAEESGLDIEMVHAAASMLGAGEDFDGLVNTVEDEAGLSPGELRGLFNPFDYLQDIPIPKGIRN